MLTILRRLWPRRRAAASITMGVHVVAVPKPIPFVEREPVPRDADADGLIWFGKWVEEWRLWDWRLGYAACSMETHWLPASVEVLPTRCCPPEVG